MSLLFLLLVAPVFFFAVTWAVVTVFRICFPEKVLPFDGSPDPEPLSMRRVGVHQIYLHSRRLLKVTHRDYEFTEGYSCGVPEGWHDDLQRRRN